MKFYTTFHKYYCGIDLHARILYVCIIDDRGNKVVHQKIKADKHELLRLISPYLEDIVIGVEQANRSSKSLKQIAQANR
ncbi:hypothetical protein PSMA106859_14725 [Pseudoalteromonas maricaloris]